MRFGSSGRFQKSLCCRMRLLAPGKIVGLISRQVAISATEPKVDFANGRFDFPIDAAAVKRPIHARFGNTGLLQPFPCFLRHRVVKLSLCFQSARAKSIRVSGPLPCGSAVARRSTASAPGRAASSSITAPQGAGAAGRAIPSHEWRRSQPARAAFFAALTPACGADYDPNQQFQS